MAPSQRIRLKVNVSMASDKVEKVLVLCDDQKSVASKIEWKLEQMGVKENNEPVRIMRISVDGYDVGGEEGDVLRDDDVVVAESYAVWLKSVIPLCQNAWCTVTEEDFGLERHFFVCAGRSTRDKIFVAGGEGANVRSGTVKYLSFVDDLTAKTTLFEDERVRASQNAASLVLSVKPSQAEVATAYEVDVISEEYHKTADPSATASHSPPPDLPASERSGPSFVAPGSEDAVEPPGENEIVAEGGDPDVIIALDHKVNTETYQATKPGDVLVQFVAFNARIFNKKSEPYEIADVTVKISKDDPGGKEEVMLGDRGAPFYYKFREHRSLKIEPRSHHVVSVVYTVDLKNAKVWDTQARRLHHSLQSGFEAAISFVGYDDNSTHTLKVSVPPSANLKLPDPTNVLKAVDCPELVGFAYCDDLEASERIAVAVGLAKDGTFFKVTRLPNRGLSFGGQHYLRRNQLAKLAYQAGDASEISVKELCYQDKSSMAGVRKADVVALIHQKQVYALKITLQTNTGKSVEYVKLPPLRLK